ncbi:MAG: hypothetical protein ACLQPD_29795 [Desulfomonilaceae bacterium]
MVETAICTVATCNYFHFAKTVMESIAKTGTAAERFVFLVDATSDDNPYSSNLFRTITLERISIPKRQQTYFTHSAFEMSALSKPFIVDYLLHHGYTRVLYIDADTYVYHSLDRTIGQLDYHDGLFTPHITRSLDDEHTPNDLDVLTNGTINTGFFALKACNTTGALLKWWQEKVIHDCYNEAQRGVFVEQKWIDLIASLFPTFVLDRSPGMNVAYWNLPHKQMTKTGVTYYVDAAPLIFFHFSGFDPHNPSVLSKYDTRFLKRGMPEPIPELIAEYVDRLKANGLDLYGNQPYRFDYFSDGKTFISPLIRKAYRNNESIQRVYGEDPFNVNKDPGFGATYNLQAYGPKNPVTPILVAFHSAEEEARRMFPNPVGASAIGLARWFLQWGLAKYRVDEAFWRPVEMFIADMQGGESPGSSSVSKLSRWVLGLRATARPTGTNPDGGNATGASSLNRLMQTIGRCGWRLLSKFISADTRARIKIWLIEKSAGRVPAKQSGKERRSE